MPKLVLLDGHSLAYRAFYALPTDLATPAGQVTNAVFGFTSMVIKLFTEEHPEAAAVAWDTPEATFRSEVYPEYKANRESAPDLFRGQLPLMKEVAEALRLHQFEVPGYEADDVIATLAHRAADAGWEVLVVTGDRDAFQLIGGSIKVVYTRRGISDTVMADAEWIGERYGIDPGQYVDYAALRGDPSDNLPGVPGVGEKTATKLLQGYGSLEGIFEHLEEQTPRLRQNLADAEEQVYLNRRLAALQRDAPVGQLPGDLVLDDWDRAEVRKVFDALAFRSLWERLEEAMGGGITSAEVLEVEVTTELDAAKARRLLLSGPASIQPLWGDGELLGMAVASDEDGAKFIPADLIDDVGPVLADRASTKQLHDAKELQRWLLFAGHDLGGIAFDTALAAYVINPAERAPGLSDLAATVLGVELRTLDPDEGADVAQTSLVFDAAAGPDLEAGGRAAVAVARLVPELTDQLEARGGLSLFREIELPLIRVLARMEYAGIGVDRDYLVELGESLRDRLATVEKQIYDAAGEPFNVNSTLQLREMLFEKLALPVLKKTPKGAPSTDASVLAKLVDEHPVVESLLRYREMEKLRSTYVDGLLPLIRPDGRIHARFNQTGAATGRLSSEQPNLQNIPVRSEEGRTIRRAFVAEEGCRFLVADYSQIELRILAHLSGDPGLVSAFEADEDIHRATAMRVFGSDDAETRNRSKMINFGLLYGMEAFGLAQRLDISKEEAAEHMEAYFAQFPDVKEFMGGIVDEARDEGYTTTILGRRRYLPELASGNYRERQMGERMALNAPIQGSAADIIKKAMVELDPVLEDRGDGTAMILQIHDELVLETPQHVVDEVARLVAATMEGIVPLRVPLKVDVATGANLAETKMS